jgi:hypothetical protein
MKGIDAVSRKTVIATFSMEKYDAGDIKVSQKIWMITAMIVM